MPRGGVRFEALVDLGDNGDLEDRLATGDADLFRFMMALKHEQLLPFVRSFYFFCIAAKNSLML